MKTFNKRGDQGETSLLFGRRVPKCHPRCEAYGVLDEAVSFLGLARNLAHKQDTPAIILEVQKDLFKINAELATLPEDYERFLATFQPTSPEMADRLEERIGGLESRVKMPDEFVIPAGNAGAACLDIARATIRRAERRLVELRGDGSLRNEHILRYVNRLADLLFTLARYEET